VAADPLSLFKSLSITPRLMALTLVLQVGHVNAETTPLYAADEHWIAYLEAHTPEELSSILGRAESLLDSAEGYPSQSPIALILHGEETRAFLKANYSTNRALVDQAARLDAYNVIDVQVCETWMRDNAVSADQLPPFVSTVPYGPAVEQQLLEQGYDHF
jgi:intracellular sulfur oxidation DsrE/DsrF family protein